MMDPEQMRQRLAVSGLIGECEALVKTAALNPSERASLQLMLDNTLEAFGLPRNSEQEAA